MIKKIVGASVVLAVIAAIVIGISVSRAQAQFPVYVPLTGVLVASDDDELNLGSVIPNIVLNPAPYGGYYNTSSYANYGNGYTSYSSNYSNGYYRESYSTSYQQPPLDQVLAASVLGAALGGNGYYAPAYYSPPVYAQPVYYTNAYPVYYYRYHRHGDDDDQGD